MNIYEITISEKFRKFDAVKKVSVVTKKIPFLVAAETAEKALIKVRAAFTEKRFTFSKPNCIISNK